MTSCACCAGACCAADGTCSQETKAACDSAGGVWHGAGTDCADYDCTSGCCEEVTLDTCTLSICKRGYDAGTCAEECDPAVVVTPPPSGVAKCKDGTPDTATVTGSGVTFSTGDALLDADLLAVMNASYAVTFECDGRHSGQSAPFLPPAVTEFFYTGNYSLRVDVRLEFQPTRIASITVYDFLQTPPEIAKMELDDGLATEYSSECNAGGTGIVYLCVLFDGVPTSTSGAGDYSGAYIDVT